MGILNKSFDMLKRLMAGGVVVGPANKIAIVSQNNNSWSLPKGHREKGETVLETAKREIYEETGIRPADLKLIKKFKSYERNKINPSGTGETQGTLSKYQFYLFTTKTGRLSPLDKENPRALFVKIDSVSRRLTHPKDKKFFENIKKDIIISLTKTKGGENEKNKNFH